MTLPLITLLMPVWNSNTRLSSDSNFTELRNALTSITNQTFKNFELHILDNQSDDGTFQFLEDWSRRDSRIKLMLDSRQRFPEAAIQLLAENAKSELIAIVNDDDFWEPEFLEKIVKSFHENPDSDLIFPRARSIDTVGNKGRELVNQKFLESISLGKSTEEVCQDYFHTRSVIPTMFGLFKRESFLKSLPLHPFDQLGANIDNRFMLQFLSHGHKLVCVDEVLFYYRDRPRRVTGFDFDSPDTAVKSLDDLIKRYIQHQLEFYLLAVSLLSGEYKNRIERITYLYSTVHHIGILLDWISNEYAKTNALKEIAKGYSSTIKEVRTEQNQINSVIKISESEYRNPHALVNTRILRQQLIEPVLTCLINLISRYRLKNRGNVDALELESILEKVIEASTYFAEVPELQINTTHQSSVCVYTCSFNLSKFVDFTMNSISTQKNVRIEHLVVDGGSKDDSLSIISKYADAKVISEYDRGFIDGAWKAVEATEAKYITQCCVSDAYANSTWLASAVSELESNPNISLVWGFPQYLTEDDQPGAVSYEFLHWKEIPQEENMYLFWLKSGFFFPEGNFVCRTSVYKNCLPRFEECDDIEPFLEFTNRFHEQGYLSRGLPIVANYGRQHESQLSSIQESSGILELMRENYQKRIKIEKRKFRKKGRKNFIDPDGLMIQTMKFKKVSIKERCHTEGTILAKKFFHYLPKCIQNLIRKVLVK